MNPTPNTFSPLQRARIALEGLSVGDAFGERFFRDIPVAERMIAERTLPPETTWFYTDDTEMALSIYYLLKTYGELDQDLLAFEFCGRHDQGRGYGSGMHRYISQVRTGADWRAVARNLFDGSGSFGNGGAMRSAPVGAFYADHLDLVVEQAARSAEVTHAHPEGIAGAVAVAVAAAHAWRLRENRPTAAEFLDLVAERTPPGEVHQGILKARDMADSDSVDYAVSRLGNGTAISAADTVPFALWCAAKTLDSFEDAMWLTVSGFGDRDTTCAIVGGIVALSVGPEGIPDEWVMRRERLPRWCEAEKE